MRNPPNPGQVVGRALGAGNSQGAHTVARRLARLIPGRTRTTPDSGSLGEAWLLGVAEGERRAAARERIPEPRSPSTAELRIIRGGRA